MKIGVRTPNMKKRVKARTTGKVKRAVKKSVNPLYGKKGMGLVNNPKKAMYNKVYNKTTISVDNLVMNKSKGNNKNSSNTVNYDNRIKKQNILVHIVLFFLTAGIGNIIYACIISSHNKKVNYQINSLTSDINYEANIDTYNSGVDEVINTTRNYEVMDYKEELKVQTINYNTSYSYSFEKEKIEGYKILKEDRIVGCYYRQENIEEVLDTFGKSESLRFNLVAERDYHNEYDSNAIKISIIYLFNDEVRKMHIGFLSKETALELKQYDDIKVALTKIESINYKDTNLAIYLKDEIVDEIKEKQRVMAEKKRKLEEERKLRELNFKVAFEMNQLAMNLEKMGRIEEAVENYKESIKLGFDGSYPFDRLNVYYRKQKDYDNEIANCIQAINLFQELEVVGRCDASQKLLRYKERLERATELRQKKENRIKSIEDKAKAKEEKIRVKEIEKENKIKIKKERIKEVKKIDLNNKLDTTRVCTICNEEKLIEDFEKSGKDSKGNIKYKHQCKKCRNELRRKKNK